MDVVKISCADLMSARQSYDFVDVRSPSEFERGHVHGAHNIPLFSDQLRALVGTIYVREGKQAALKHALRELGPRLYTLVEQARTVYKDKTLCVYCARGGMRSASVGWLFNLCGLPVVVMQGGYKAFRQWAHTQLLQPKNICLLAGKTGAGKTELLQQWARAGKQVIDLEAFARHKGSVLGGDRAHQASQQQFENDVACAWSLLDAHEPVWLEDESRKIGAVIIPEPIWQCMQAAPAHILETPREQRLARVLREYGCLDRQWLLHAIGTIKQQLGTQLHDYIVCALKNGDLMQAADLLLTYYDRKYEHGFERKKLLGCRLIF